MANTKLEQTHLIPKYGNPAVGNIPSYQSINGQPQLVLTKFYTINDLPRIRESELNNYLFEVNDFVIPPQSFGREWVKLKAGKLFIEFCPDGKGSSMLSIKLIDRDTRSLRSFLNLNMPRHADLALENILPIDSSTYNSTKTPNPRLWHSVDKDKSENTEEAKLNFCRAYVIKSVLTKLMLDLELTEEDKLDFLSNYKELYLKNYLPPSSKNNSICTKFDIAHFGKHPEYKPTTLYEVSAKIAAVALENLSITEEEITEILKEYLSTSEKPPNYFNDSTIQNEILDTLLDNGRYPLKACIDDAPTQLNIAIKNIPGNIPSEIPVQIHGFFSEPTKVTTKGTLHSDKCIIS